MSSNAFDAAARRAAESVSRRASLLSLGAAALAATAAAPDIGIAKKKARKCSKTCRQKQRKRCRRDTAACREIADASPFCSLDPEGSTCVIFKACCAACSARGFLACLAEAEETQAG